MTEFFNTPSEPNWYENDAQNKKTREEEAKAEIRQKAQELSEVSRQLLERLKENGKEPETTVVQEQYEYKRDSHLGFLERRRPSSVGNRYRQKDSVDVGKGWLISTDGSGKAGRKVIILMENGDWRLGRDITEAKPEQDPPKKRITEQVQDLGVIDLDKDLKENSFHPDLEQQTGYRKNTQSMHEYRDFVSDGLSNVYANILAIESDLRTRGRELLNIE